jgi:hypothetical protein
MSHTAAFHHFGTSPKNVQWSWSARNEETKTVVVRLWQHEFEKKDGKLVYKAGKLEPGEKARLGHKELLENLRWAVDHADGRVSVIIAIAKDKMAKKKSIADSFASKMQLRVTHVDEATGKFEFEAEGLSPPT